MSWTPAKFAKDADRHYAHAQSYDPANSTTPDADLYDALRAVLSAQDAAREVITALALDPSRLTAERLLDAEQNLSFVEASVRKMRAGFYLLKN